MGWAKIASTIEVPSILLSLELHHSAPISFLLMKLWGVID
jgi:hypothetical protein